ncbi:MAG: hypothetical protein WAV38_35445, partial [Xanthobacteraceae bacterium]
VFIRQFEATEGRGNEARRADLESTDKQKIARPAQALRQTLCAAQPACSFSSTLKSGWIFGAEK